MTSSNIDFFKEGTGRSIDVKRKILDNDTLFITLSKVCDAMVACLKDKKQTFFCGNGGSASDAQHLAAELSGRFYVDRPPLDAEVLGANFSYLTAVANDYSYEDIFSRAIQGQGRPGDVLVGLSTSGNSKNVVKAFEAAKKLQITTVAFTGESGGKLKELSDYLLNVPSSDTPRIQESHIMLGHLLCERIENLMFAHK